MLVTVDEELKPLPARARRAEGGRGRARGAAQADHGLPDAHHARAPRDGREGRARVRRVLAALDSDRGCRHPAQEPRPRARDQDREEEVNLHGAAHAHTHRSRCVWWSSAQSLELFLKLIVRFTTQYRLSRTIKQSTCTVSEHTL